MLLSGTSNGFETVECLPALNKCLVKKRFDRICWQQLDFLVLFETTGTKPVILQNVNVYGLCRVLII